MKIRPPKGWRLLKRNEIVKRGDKLCDNGTDKWYTAGMFGHISGDWIDLGYIQAYVRKIKER